MKLDNIKPNIETSDELEEQFFSIQDQGMIFDILRNKMYSNTILAICREISCNARDAHREVGKFDVPIEITLPTALEPFYKIKDYGPGISPDRMSNIFIKYTASTKREDNIQTGGYGLGSKTPFSYSDTFTINTIFNGKKYSYACFIDETKVGKLALLAEEETNECNGTEIVVPVKIPDIRNFNQYTEQSTRHWDIKPIIKGGTIQYLEQKTVLEGNKWKITGQYDYNTFVKALIDGIEYPIPFDTISNIVDAKMVRASYGVYFLYFDNGEISLSANREQIYFDKKTKDKIAERFSQIKLEIKKKIQEKIDSFNNMWDAQVYYKQDMSKIFNDFSIFHPVEWKGKKLFNAYYTPEIDMYYFSKNKYSANGDKVYRRKSNSVYFEEHSALCLNDAYIANLTNKHVRKAFDDNPNLKILYVACPKDQAELDEWKKTFPLDQMGTIYLSSLTKVPKTRKASISSGQRLILFTLNSYGAFKQISYSEYEKDTNKKVLCKLRNPPPGYSHDPKSVLIGGKPAARNVMGSLKEKFPDVSFYGVEESITNDRIDKDLSDMISIDTFLDKELLNNKKYNYIQATFCSLNSDKFNSGISKHFDKIEKEIDKTSDYFKLIECYKLIKKNCGFDSLHYLFQSALGDDFYEKNIDNWLKNNPKYNADNFIEKCNKKYPLLQLISNYRYYGDKEPTSEDIIQYINLIDKK